MISGGFLTIVQATREMEKSNGGLLFAALIVAALLPVIFANPEGRVTV